MLGYCKFLSFIRFQDCINWNYKLMWYDINFELDGNFKSLKITTILIIKLFGIKHIYTSSKSNDEEILLFILMHMLILILMHKLYL